MTGNKAKGLPALRTMAKSLLALLIILGVGYFYWQEFSKNQFDLVDLKLSVSVGHLAVALVLCLLSYLFDAVIWKMIIKTRLDSNRIKFPEIVAVIYASGIFRYFPGRIWTVTAQTLWLGKFGIGKSFTLYINLVCVIELVIFSLYSCLIYLAMYTKEFPGATLFTLFSLIISANILFNFYSCSLLNYILLMFKKITRIEVEPIHSSARLMSEVQLVFTFSWLLYGMAVFFLVSGLGLQIVPVDIIPVVASMSLSWLAGILTVVTPAGLGVREGMMLWMLKPAIAFQTALLLPILTRLLMLISEGLLGLVAFYLGVKRDTFALEKKEK